MTQMPANLVRPVPSFEAAYDARAATGSEVLARSRIAFVGLARNCAGPLAANLERLLAFASHAAGWQLHIESNDCTDQTLEVLAGFCREHRQATFHYENYGRKHYTAEFSGPRTIALAEYRDKCQRWVRACAADCEFTVVMDWDAWGGWSDSGLVNGLGWLGTMPEAFGMASVSLFQHDFGGGVDWYHYDLWALRGVGQRECYYDTYRNGCGAFGYTWFPPVGSPPVLVSSAFGGLAIYRTAAFLQGTYDGTTDCEHVPFHQSIAKATKQSLYLNPSQRCVMHWLPEQANAGQHGNH